MGIGSSIAYVSVIETSEAHPLDLISAHSSLEASIAEHSTRLNHLRSAATERSVKRFLSDKDLLKITMLSIDIDTVRLFEDIL